MGLGEPLLQRRGLLFWFYVRKFERMTPLLFYLLVWESACVAGTAALGLYWAARSRPRKEPVQITVAAKVEPTTAPKKDERPVMGMYEPYEAYVKRIEEWEVKAGLKPHAEADLAMLLVRCDEVAFQCGVYKNQRPALLKKLDGIHSEFLKISLGWNIQHKEAFLNRYISLRHRITGALDKRNSLVNEAAEAKRKSLEAEKKLRKLVEKHIRMKTSDEGHEANLKAADILRKRYT